MNHRPLFNYPTFKLMQQVRKPAAWAELTVLRYGAMCAWIHCMVSLQAIAIEDFEYYAVYESGFLDLAISFITFKPVEYLLEVACLLLCERWLCSSGFTGNDYRLADREPERICDRTESSPI